MDTFPHFAVYLENTQKQGKHTGANSHSDQKTRTDAEAEIRKCKKDDPVSAWIGLRKMADLF